MENGGETTVIRARQLLQVGRAEEAVVLLTSSPDTPSDIAALNTLSRAYLMCGDHENSIAAATATIALDHESWHAWYQHAYALGFARRSSEALPSIQRALQLAPESVTCHAEASQIYTKLGAFGPAVSHANLAIELEPTHEGGWEALSRVRLAQGDPASAEQCAIKVLEINPVSTNGKLLLASAQAKGGNRDGEAFDTLISALRENPSEQVIRKTLITLAKPQVHVPPVVRGLLIVTGLAALLLLLWAVVVVVRWFELPRDVRRLIMADRSARWRIFGAVVLSSVFIAAVAAIAVYAFFSSR